MKNASVGDLHQKLPPLSDVVGSLFKEQSFDNSRSPSKLTTIAKKETLTELQKSPGFWSNASQIENKSILIRGNEGITTSPPLSPNPHRPLFPSHDLLPRSQSDSRLDSGAPMDRRPQFNHPDPLPKSSSSDKIHQFPSHESSSQVPISSLSSLSSLSSPSSPSSVNWMSPSRPLLPPSKPSSNLVTSSSPSHFTPPSGFGPSMSSDSLASHFQQRGMFTNPRLNNNLPDSLDSPQDSLLTSASEPSLRYVDRQWYQDSGASEFGTPQPARKILHRDNVPFTSGGLENSLFTEYMVSRGESPNGERSQHLSYYYSDLYGDLLYRRRKTRNKLPSDATTKLKDWLEQHSAYPYPTEQEKLQLISDTGLTWVQINNWFANARRANNNKKKLMKLQTNEGDPNGSITSTSPSGEGTSEHKISSPSGPSEESSASSDSSPPHTTNSSLLTSKSTRSSISNLPHSSTTTTS